MVLQSLNKIGEKFSKLFREPEENLNTQDFFSADPISKILPWEAYDEEFGIFIGKNTLGFTVEALPLVGSSQAAQKQIESIFQEIIEEGDSIQCLLWADHRVTPFLNGWAQARNQSKEIYREIAKKRAEYFQASKKITPRIFRFILSYTILANPDPITLEKLKKKKEQVLKTLKGLTFAFSWDINDFLEAVSALINYTTDRGVEKRNWNPFQSICSQLPIGGSIEVDENHLKWTNDTTTYLKTFRAVNYPANWSLAGMHRLIGDVFRDAFRIDTPFYLHFGVHCPPQSKEEGKFKRRSLLIDKQGRSQLLMRFIPSLAEELQEADSVRKELSQSERFVWTQLSAGVWAQEKDLSTAEQALKSVFRINQFTLVENRYLHLPAYLSALPMTWGEYVQDLKELNLLRTTITLECGAFTPLQGEWMGTRSAGMLLIGRRGQVVNWNPFDNKSGNYNIVVVGRSGSGKSVFMQDLLLSGLGTESKVYILEVGRSFEKLCHLLDGQHIEFSNHSHICLNPFSYLSKIQAEERDTSISFIKSIIATMAAPSEGTTDYENALIEKAIRYSWENKADTATISDVSDWLQAQKDEAGKSTRRNAHSLYEKWNLRQVF